VHALHHAIFGLLSFGVIAGLTMFTLTTEYGFQRTSEAMCSSQQEMDHPEAFYDVTWSTTLLSCKAYIMAGQRINIAACLMHTQKHKTGMSCDQHAMPQTAFWEAVCITLLFSRKPS